MTLVKLSYAILLVETNDLRVCLNQDDFNQTLSLVSKDIDLKKYNNKPIDEVCEQLVEEDLGFSIEMTQFKTIGIQNNQIEIVYFGTIPYNKIKDIDFNKTWISILRGFPPRLSSQHRALLEGLKQHYNFTPTY
jgi:hypothetical protein